jgi:hypothetical protein
VTRTTYRVVGTLVGPIWWPIGAPASKSFEYVTAERPATMRALADAVMAREDGDFAGAPRMMADTVVTIIRWRATGHHGRSWNAEDLPSLAAYVTAEWPSWGDV